MGKKKRCQVPGFGDQGDSSLRPDENHRDFAQNDNAQFCVDFFAGGAGWRFNKALRVVTSVNVTDSRGMLST